MGRRATRTLILDAGGLIAIERADRRLAAVLDATHNDPDGEVVIPAGVLGQVWRGGRRSARLGRLLATRQVTVADLTREVAQAAGVLCGARGAADVIDASVVLAARAHGPSLVVTSDAADLRRLDPGVALIEV